MKRAFLIVAVSTAAWPCLAQQSQGQQSKVPQQGSPTQPVRIEMVCRDMGTTGSYLTPNETMIGNKACHPVDVQRLGNGSAVVNAPVVSADPASTAAPASAPAASTGAATPADVYAAHDKIVSAPVDNSVRVYVTSSTVWDARGGWSGKASATAAPPSPSTQPAANDKDAVALAAEVDKLITDINKQCPQVMITSALDRASFSVTLDHQKKGRLSQENKIVVFNHDGDDVFSADTKGLDDSLDNACKAILKSAGR
jgi:hypothetical protein